ncbi:phosphate butyryltransferase [Bacillus sp. FJAT-44742]|uniref:phosphate butyryltransferase n=1 Tax=Bacillus sp. FJAT-44742 TaxID=2014005 RepID=UPI000C23F569|nr:phosphate butyryltransferase [Bacillus sp. FJAT-44742]
MNLQEIMENASAYKKKTIAIAAADDERVIDMVKEAINNKLGEFRLYGNEEVIRSFLTSKGLSEMSSIKVIPARDVKESARLSVMSVREGKADLLMKGMIPTSVLLKAVLNREYGLRKGKVLSHVAAFEVPGFKRLFFVSDSAMNIAPDLHQKVEITNNSVEVARAMGVINPKVAPISAVEVVNPDMSATIDAAALSQMNKRGQINHCVIDGPLALDNAISVDAANYKGVGGEVAGRADILLVPTVETGNILYKSLVYFAGAKVGGIIAGAKAPIILTSRADTAASKLYSIAIACHVSEYQSTLA